MRRLFLPVLLVVALGCGQTKETITLRPQPGDRLTPVLSLAEPWKAGQATPVQARLYVAGAGPERELRLRELRPEEMPQLRITFLGQAGGPLGPPQELEMEPDC